MAFTEAQRVQIRVALGYPALFRQSEQDWMIPLEMAMSAVDSYPESQALIEGRLAKIATIDTQRMDALERIQAGKVGTIELRGYGESADLMRQRREWAQDIARTLGVAYMPPIARGGGNRVLQG